MAAESLSERAMLVSLTINNWAGRKVNKTVTARVVQDAHADQEAGRWWTQLVDKKALARLNQLNAAGRDAMYSLTMPWNDNGGRILPATVYFQFLETMRKLKAEYLAAAEEFIAAYPDMVRKAETRLGKLFNPKDFPPVHELRRKFGWEWNIINLPDPNDFRVQLGDEQTAQVRQDMEKQIAATFHSAIRDLWDRLYAAVTHMAERLADPKGIFRDSLVENVRELVDLLPKLNVTGDQDLTAMTQAVAEQLAVRKPDELRENKRERKDAAKAAQKIADRMAAFMGAGGAK